MMTRASNKADGIAYSWHDMPVEFSSPKGNLKNYYSANGTKLKTVVEPAGGGDVSTTHYFSGIEYKDEELHTAYWSDGRANFAESEPQHEYYIKDHLEDRTVLAAASKKVIRNHFLRREPKTLLRVGGWDVPNVDSNGNSLLPTDGETRYTYNGKEYIDDIDIGILDFGFRYYDPAIGRFTSVDPIAEDFPHLSTFNYASNNPISNFDLWGLQGVDFNTGEVDNMQGYFKQNARTGSDDCMTCHIKGIEILTNNKIPKGDNSDGMNSIVRQRSSMQNEGLANETQTISFENSSGNRARTVGQADAMNGSVAETATSLSEGTDNSVFGVSMADGYHTMTLTVTSTELAGPTPDGSALTATTFTLSDQGTNSGTLRKGNLQFASGSDLDKHLTDYIKNSSPENFPATVEIHQIVNPNR